MDDMPYENHCKKLYASTKLFKMLIIPDKEVHSLNMRSGAGVVQDTEKFGIKNTKNIKTAL